MTSAAPNDDSTYEEREANLTPDEALTLAIELHKVGRLDDAELFYAALLEGWRDHPDVLNHMGALQQQRGNHELALALLRRAVEIAPDVPGIWNNLGNVLNLDDAERAFRRSIALADSPEARANLANVLRRRDQWSDSEAECRRALELAPDFPDAWHNLSLALMGQDRIEEAVNAANRAVVLLPPHRRRRDSYTRALVQAGELEQAIKMYREWLADEPDNAFVQHKLAACGGEPAPARASDAYVELVFDGFAARFDAKLASLLPRARACRRCTTAGPSAAGAPVRDRRHRAAGLGCAGRWSPVGRVAYAAAICLERCWSSPSGAPCTTRSTKPSWSASCAAIPTPSTSSSRPIRCATSVRSRASPRPPRAPCASPGTSSSPSRR
jgi:Flp pilus assembly protein TadD